MIRVSLLLATALAASGARADEKADLEALTDLPSLTERYRELRTEIKDEKTRYSKKVRLFSKGLIPLVKKIGKLDTRESYEFLKEKYKPSEPSYAALHAEAMLYSSQDEVIAFALQEYAERPPVIRAGLLKGLGETPNDLAPYTGKLLQMASTEQAPEVQRYVPKALGRLDTLVAAKLMFSKVASIKNRSPSFHPQLKYSDAVARALGSSTNEEVRDWLRTRGFRAAGRNSLRLEVVAHAAGALLLEETRGDLEKLLSHRDPATAAAAAEAIAKIGAAPSLKKLIAALKKGRARKDVRFRTKVLDALASDSGESALDYLLKTSSDRDPTTRAIVMESLVQADSPEAFRAVLEALKDPEANVRSTALVALSARRNVEMIGSLIDYLETEKHERLQIDALRLLVSLTGLNLELNAADWRKWWDGAKDTFKLPENVEVAAPTGVRRQTADDVIVPKYFGMEVGATNRVTFIVDVSGSMRDPLESDEKTQRLDVLKRELTRVVEALPEESAINIVAFHHNFVPWKKQLFPLRGGGRKEALKFISTLQARSRTNVYDTLEFALRDKDVDTFYLLSDGEPTAGRYTDDDDILREIKTLNRSRAISINTISFGEESELLENLARQNHGEYRYVEA